MRRPVGRQQRRQRERGELGQAGQRRKAAARRPGEIGPIAGRQQCRQHQHGDQRVVAVALQGEQREREGDPCVGQGDAQGRAARAPAEQEQQPDGQQVEEDRGCVGGGQVVPAPAPAEDLPEGDVGLVVDRPVGVAVFVVGRIGAVEGPAVGDPLGADHPRVPDVHDVGVGDVQGDPEADQEDDADRQPGSGDEQSQRSGLGTPVARPAHQREHARKQVEQRRVGERAPRRRCERG